MSNIYIQEPPTSGKVCLKTTVGDIDVELWSKECPKACRNFVQLCSEGYYNGTIFHRVVHDFIAQGGDPTGSGMGGDSVYGKPFKDEFHSRLRFVRRGLVAMANAGSNDNGSQFFFTLSSTPDLQNKHTIFAQVTGNTLYNMLKLGECEVDKNEKPLYPPKILSSEVLSNPFPDIVPRVLPSAVSKSEESSSKQENSVKATKNFNLLSFGDEAEEEEETVVGLNKAFVGKGKSAHDLAKDERLSREPAVRKEELFQKDSLDAVEDDSALAEKSRVKNEVMKKLQKLKESKSSGFSDEPTNRNEEEGEENFTELMDDEKTEEEKSQLDVLKAQFKQLQKEMLKSKKPKVEEAMEKTVENPALAFYRLQKETYKDNQAKYPKRKTSEREAKTMDLLKKFEQKLSTIREDAAKTGTSKDFGEINEDDEDEDLPGSDWMTKKFVAEDASVQQAKDANVKTDDSFDIYDPRNPMNKRRREAADEKNRKKHRK